jgi:predicted TIM-barrel fold metal-dependent hydrolase
MIIDVNAYLSRWPFRRTPCDELPRLMDKYREFGVQQAWVGTFDGLFHRDLAAANARLADACRQSRDVELLPFGSVNPRLPDWQEDLRRCAEEHRMPGIRLHPNYHGYSLEQPVFGELLDGAVQAGLIVQLVVRMDDVRVQHPLMQIADVDTKPLAALLAARPQLRLVLLNALATLRGGDLRQLVAGQHVWCEIAMKEGLGGIAELLKDVPPTQVLFGSHLPLYALESAILKLREAQLSAELRAQLERGNAELLLRSRQ